MPINEMNMQPVDNMQVTTSEPVDTSSTVPNEEPSAPTQTEAEVEPTVEESSAEPVVPTEEAAPTEPVTPTEEAPVEPTVPTGKELMDLLAKQNYQPTETELNILDDYGNVDPAKFQDFMKQNNQNVFSQAVEAVTAKIEARDMEADTWGTVYQDFPEVEQNPALDKALRGARIQDLSAGGDGDLARLAKDIVAPIRQAKIDAIEQANKTIKQAESLESAVPSVAPAPQTEVPLMQQLTSALAKGDQQRATELRHAIRKERIFGKDK